MRYIKSLDNNFFSKTVHRMDRTDPLNKGGLVIYPTSSYEKMYNFINDANSEFSKFFATTELDMVYTPKKLDFEITKLRVVETLDQNKTYQNFKANCESLNIFPTSLEVLSSRNLIIDTIIFLERMFKKIKTNQNEYVIDAFRVFSSFINGIIADYNYVNKYLLFDLTEFTDELSTETSIKENDYKEKKNLFFYFFYMLKYYRDDLFELMNGFTVIFVSTNGIVKFNLNEIRDDIKSGRIKGNVINMLLLRINMCRGRVSGEEIMNEINDIKGTKYELKKEEVTSNEVEENKEKLENKEMNKLLKNMSDKTKSDSKNIALVDQYIRTVAQEKDEATANKASKILDDIKSNMINRDRELNPKEKIYKSKIDELSVNNQSKKEIVDSIRDMKIEKTTFKAVTVDPTMKENSFINFDRSYDKYLRNAHLKKIGKHFADTDVPLYLTKNVEIIDASDSMNLVDDVKYTFKDKDGLQQTVHVRVPKLTRAGFLYLGGQKVTLTNQLYALPINKIGEDVIITSVYNKVFMTYKGSKYLSPNQSRLVRAIKKLDPKDMEGTIKFGDYSERNLASGKTTPEYIGLSAIITDLKTENIDFTFRFDESFRKYGEHYKEGYIVLGTYKDKTIILDIQTDTVKGDESIDGMQIIDAIIKLCEKDNKTLYEAMMSINETNDSIQDLTISDLLIGLSKSEISELFDSLEKIKTVPTSLAASYIKLMDRWIPLIYVLMHTNGLFTVLERAKIEHNVEYKINIKPDTDGVKKKPKYNKYKQIMIETGDAFVTFNLNSLENIALLTPLTKLDLLSYRLADLENKDYTTVIIENYGGNTNLPNYLDTFKNCLIDPFTKEALEDYNLPTDFIDVMLYANMLLATGKSKSDIDISTKKLRHAEILTALTYQVIASAYNEYAIRKKRGNKKITISVDRDAVIKELHKLNTTAPYSSINPVEERSSLTEVSMRGLRGVNLEQSYDVVKRSFDTSHYGLVGLPSNFGPNVGVSKFLTFEPNVISPKGYIKPIEDLSEVKNLNPWNTLTSTELLNPGITKHDNPQRIAYAVGQSNQILPVLGSSVNLVTYGYDEILPSLTEDFAFSALDDGEIVGLDQDFIAVKYVDGTTEVHRLNRIERNAAKSFYTVNKINVCKGVKLGKKVKKGDILAYNLYFFKNNSDNRPTFSDGPSALVVVHSAPHVFEDATIVSESFSRQLGTFITKKYDIKFNADANIVSHKNIGDTVRSTDVLLSFNKVTDDDFLNSLLGESASKLNIIEKKNKIAGEVVGIRIYYTCEFDKLHKTSKDFITNIRKLLEPKEVLLHKYGTNFDKATDTELPTKVAIGTKKNGVKIEENEILVEYYVRSFNIFSIGDKLTYQAALKGIGAKIMPDHLMPFCMQSGKRADCVLRMVSLGARQVYSVPIMGIASKGLNKLNNNLQEMFKDY